MSLYDDVYGITYKSAEQQKNLLTEALRQQNGKGFESLDELKAWAHEHLLDKVLFSNMSHSFM